MSQYEDSLVQEKAFLVASESFPLEYHIELVRHAFDVGNSAAFEELSQAALLRCQFRRIEVPYLADVDLLASTTSQPNIPNGYEKIPVDLNEAELKSKLAKLSQKKKTQALNATEKEETKDPKKLEKGKTDRNSKSEFLVDSEVGHIYYFLALKRSYNPESAIYDIQVVMADEKKPPLEKAKEGYKIIALPIAQYTGVQETTHLIPYLLCKLSSDNLKDEEQKKNLIIDILPILGKSPHIRPPFGYEKIDLDLRQVPKEFIKIPNLDYVFLSYKYKELGNLFLNSLGRKSFSLMVKGFLTF